MFFLSNPVNRELWELRMVKEHYLRVLENDALLKSNGNPDGVRLLSDGDIVRIRGKISGLDERIGVLLSVTDCF